MPIPTATRSDQLAAQIRRQIVEGTFQPGNRLPTFQSIEAEYSVSRGVAQLAVDRLKRDGFIDPDSRHGLRVDRQPPHLHRYGLVFPVAAGDPTWTRFSEVMVRESRLLQESHSGHEFDVFAGTSDFREGPDVVDRLKDSIARDQLAGLVLTPGTFELADIPPFNTPDLPKVFVFYQPGCGQGPIITGDGNSIIDRSLGYLSGCGCQRVAVIRPDGAYSSLSADDFARAGLALHPQWLQIVGRGDTAVLSSLVPLLMDYPAGGCPDGLLILDDNAVDHAIAALARLGVRIGSDLHIVAHSNWPSRAPSVLPIRRIGFHVGHMLARCIDAIDLQRRGEQAPEVQRIPATFEDEIDAS